MGEKEKDCMGRRMRTGWGSKKRRAMRKGGERREGTKYIEGEEK